MADLCFPGFGVDGVRSRGTRHRRTRRFRSGKILSYPVFGHRVGELGFTESFTTGTGFTVLHDGKRERASRRERIGDTSGKRSGNDREHDGDGHRGTNTEVAHREQQQHGYITSRGRETAAGVGNGKGPGIIGSTHTTTRQRKGAEDGRIVLAASTQRRPRQGGTVRAWRREETACSKHGRNLATGEDTCGRRA